MTFGIGSKKYFILSLLACVLFSQATEFEYKSLSGYTRNKMILAGLKSGFIGGVVTTGVETLALIGLDFYRNADCSSAIVTGGLVIYSAAAMAGFCALFGLKNSFKISFENRYNCAVSFANKLQNNMMFTFSETPKDILSELRNHYIGFKDPLKIAQKDIGILFQQVMQVRDNLRQALQKSWIDSADRTDANVVIEVLQTYIKEMYRMLNIVKNRNC